MEGSVQQGRSSYKDVNNVISFQVSKFNSSRLSFLVCLEGGPGLAGDNSARQDRLLINFWTLEMMKVSRPQEAVALP